MSQLLSYVRDGQGNVSPALSQSANILSCSLLAGNSATLTVPSTPYTTWVLLIEYGPNADVWVSDGHTAAQPAGNTFSASNSLLNPEGLRVQAGDVISFYNNGASNVDVCAALYGAS